MRRLLLGTPTSKECCLGGTSLFRVRNVADVLRSVFQKFIFLDRERHFWNILFLSGVLLLFRFDLGYLHLVCN